MSNVSKDDNSIIPIFVIMFNSNEEEKNNFVEIGISKSPFSDKEDCYWHCSDYYISECVKKVLFDINQNLSTDLQMTQSTICLMESIFILYRVAMGTDLELDFTLSLGLVKETGEYSCHAAITYDRHKRFNLNSEKTKKCGMEAIREVCGDIYLSVAKFAQDIGSLYYYRKDISL